MHLRVLILFCTIILLSSATYEITINYLEYYNLVVQGWVQMDVYSVNDNNKTTFHFTTEFRSLVHIPVFVNEKPCVDHCAYPMAVGEKVSISFFQDVGDFIQLYRETANDTILYFEGCEQSLDLCRYREQSVYALCICPANTVDVMCLLDSDVINTQCNGTTEVPTTVQTSSSYSTSASSTLSSSSTSSKPSSMPTSSSVSSSTSSSSIDSTSTLHATSIHPTLHAETSLPMLSSTVEFSTIVTKKPIISPQTTEQSTLSSTLDPTTFLSTSTVTTQSISSTTDITKASSTVLITSTLSTAPTPSKDPDKTTTEIMHTATFITSADPSSARTTADEISYLSTSTKDSTSTPLTTNFINPSSTMNVYTVRTEPSFVSGTTSDTMKPVQSTPQPKTTQTTSTSSTADPQTSTVTMDSSTHTSSIPEDTAEPTTSKKISTTMPQTTSSSLIDPSTVAFTTNLPSTINDCLHAECKTTNNIIETSSVSVATSTQSTVITTSTDVRTTEWASTLASGTTTAHVTSEESEVTTLTTSTTTSQSTTEWSTPLLTTSTMTNTLEPTINTAISSTDSSSISVQTSTSVPSTIIEGTTHQSTTSDSPSSTIYPTSDLSTNPQTTTDLVPSTEATTVISTAHSTIGRQATTDPTSTSVSIAETSSKAPTDSPTRSTNYVTSSSSRVASTTGQTTTQPAFTTMHSTRATSREPEATMITSDSVSSTSVTTTHDTTTEDPSTKFSTEPPITSTVPVTTTHISTITPTFQSTASDASSTNVPSTLSISTEASTTPEADASSHYPSTITSTKIQTTDPTSVPTISTRTLSTVYSTLFPTTIRTTSEPTPLSTTVENTFFSSTDPTSSHVPSVYSTTTITEITDSTTTNETTSINPSTASRSTPTASSKLTTPPSTHSTSKSTQKPSTSSSPSITKTSHLTTKTSTIPTTVHHNVTSSTSTGRLTTEEIQTTPAVPSLEQLADGGVSQSNVSSVLTDTYTYSQKGSDLQSDEITYITIILNKSSNVQGLKSEDSVNILLNMDSVLNANESAMRASGSSPQNLLAMLPTMVLNTNSTLINYLEGVNLGFTSTAVDCQNSESDNGMLDLGNIFETVSNPTDQGKAINSIFIPLNEICGKASVSHVFFSIYRNKGLFLGSKSFRPYSSSMQLDDMNATIPAEDSLIPKCHRQTSLPPSTPVMSGTLLSNGVSLSTIDTQSVMANLQFNVTGILAPLHGRFKVTWWDTVNLKWSLEELCSETRKGDIITATCSHLTDFTLIIDGAINDPNVCNEALMDVGYAANGISIASLLFLLCVHLLGYIPALVESSFVRYLRGHSMVQRDFVALAYTTVLLLFYIFFTLFSDQKVSGKACETVAAITYALLMASVILTICQALRTVSMFFPIAVRSFMQIILQPHVAITVSILTPFVISLLLLELTSFFRRNDGFCWVRADLILYAVVIPISFLVLNALISTILVGWKLFAAKKKFVSKGKHNDRQLRTKIIAIILMQISLGMPWILQYFTIYSPYATVWHYIFTIVMGSQGTLLTILFFYKRRRIIRSSRYESRRPVVEDNSRNVVVVD